MVVVVEVRGELPSHHRLSPALSSHQHTKRRRGVHNFQPTSCARGDPAPSLLCVKAILGGRGGVDAGIREQRDE